MNAETARRYLLTGCAFIFGSCMLGGWLQANVQEWAKASGQDQYLVGLAGPLMARLADVAQSQVLIAIGWASIGGAVILWLDYTLRRIGKKSVSRSTAPGVPSQLAISSPSGPRRSPAASPLVVPNRFYSRAEKEGIVDTMNLIQERFSGVGSKIVREAREISATFKLIGLDDEFERMRAVCVEADRLGDEFETIRNGRHPLDFAVLLAAKPVRCDGFRHALHDYLNALDLRRSLLPVAGKYGGKLLTMMENEKRHLLQAVHLFEEWMQDCERAITEVRRSIEI